jgi:hypothetical protein
VRRGSARWAQQVRGRLARDHAIRDRIGVALVGIAVGADAARQVDAGALLHDVGGLVRGGVQIGRRREGHVGAGRVGGRADRRGGGGGGASDVGAHRRQLVGRTERARDRVAVRQRFARACDPGRRLGAHAVGVRPQIAAGLDDVAAERRAIEERIVERGRRR